LIIAEVSKKGIVLVKPKIYLQNLRKCRDFNLGSAVLIINLFSDRLANYLSQAAE
jgi:hypothetical protein